MTLDEKQLEALDAAKERAEAASENFEYVTFAEAEAIGKDVRNMPPAMRSARYNILRSKDLKDWPTLREKMEMAVLCALDSWLLMTTPKERWRVGNKVGRTLYLEGKLVGMVDTEELAKAIVERMNEE